MCGEADSWAVEIIPQLMFASAMSSQARSAATACEEHLKQADRDGEICLITACFHSVKKLLEGAIVDPPVPWGTLHGVCFARSCASESQHKSQFICLFCRQEAAQCHRCCLMRYLSFQQDLLPTTPCALLSCPQFSSAPSSC